MTETAGKKDKLLFGLESPFRLAGHRLSLGSVVLRPSDLLWPDGVRSGGFPGDLNGNPLILMMILAARIAG